MHLYLNEKKNQLLQNIISLHTQNSDLRVCSVAKPYSDIKSNNFFGEKKKRIQKKLVYHFKAHWEQIEESSLRPTKELFILCLYSFHYFQVAIIIISIEKT